MDDVKNILGQQDWSEPTEVGLIKNYVQEHFKSVVKVMVKPGQIIIFAPTAALAGTLRLHSYQLAEACQTDKRLVIRIG